MATVVKAKAQYEKDTAKGKKRVRVEGKGIAGTLYFEGKLPEKVEITVEGQEEE